jgi:hypothetical protein
MAAMCFINIYGSSRFIVASTTVAYATIKTHHAWLGCDCQDWRGRITSLVFMSWDFAYRRFYANGPGHSTPKVLDWAGPNLEFHAYCSGLQLPVPSLCLSRFMDKANFDWNPVRYWQLPLSCGSCRSREYYWSRIRWIPRQDWGELSYQGPRGVPLRDLNCSEWSWYQDCQWDKSAFHRFSSDNPNPWTPVPKGGFRSYPAAASGPTAEGCFHRYGKSKEFQIRW